MSCSLVTAPILCLDFGAVPIWGVAANLLAEPAVLPLLWASLSAAAVAPVVPSAGAALAWLAGWCAWWIALCARLVSAAPFAQVSTTTSIAIACAATIGVVVTRSLPRRARGTAALAVIAALAVVGVGWWALRQPSAWQPPRGLRVTFLDVGQGDSALVEVPEGAVLVDQGPPEAHVADQLRRLGVRSLAAIVLTHPQRDHVGGAADVLRRLHVTSVLDPALPNESPDEQSALDVAREHHVTVVTARAGQRYRLGHLSLRVLWPDRAGPPGEDPNQRATVLLASYGPVDLLLTADAESDVTSRLPLRPVEILKVAHHGSEDAGLPELLRRLRPRIAVISVGAGNDYGHPRPETLDALGSVPGLRLYRTDQERPRRRRGERCNDVGAGGAWSTVGRVSQQELKSVYLLTGTDRPKIETAVERLRRHFESESVDAVTAAETSGEQAVALCNAGSLFGDRRLVVVDRLDGAKRDDNRRSGGWRAGDVNAVVAYLEDPSPGTVLALVAEELARSSVLAKACAKTGDVLEYSVPKRGRTAWVTDRFRQQGVRAEPDAVAALLQLVGDDPQALATEIEKIATWADGEPVGEREVEALVAPTRETPVFALTDAWGARDATGLLEACETMLERSDRTRREDAARIVGALATHLGRVRRLKRLAGEGVAPREAAAGLRMHPFFAEKVARQGESFGDDELTDAIVRLAELDLALKGKSRIAPELELQRALVDLGRRPGD